LNSRKSRSRCSMCLRILLPQRLFLVLTHRAPQCWWRFQRFASKLVVFLNQSMISKCSKPYRHLTEASLGAAGHFRGIAEKRFIPLRRCNPLACTERYSGAHGSSLGHPTITLKPVVLLSARKVRESDTVPFRHSTRLPGKSELLLGNPSSEQSLNR
jgi:hypothetical protein